MTGHRAYRHFSDAELLSSLDGELSWWQYFGLKMHLFRCWECRARNAELEAQAHRLSRVLRQDSFPGTRRVADARAAFDSWRWQLEQPQAQTARRNLTLTKMAVFAGGSALSAAAMFVILGKPSPVQRPVDTPAAPRSYTRRSPHPQRSRLLLLRLRVSCRSGWIAHPSSWTFITVCIGSAPVQRSRF